MSSASDYNKESSRNPPYAVSRDGKNWVTTAAKNVGADNSIVIGKRFSSKKYVKVAGPIDISSIIVATPTPPVITPVTPLPPPVVTPIVTPVVTPVVTPTPTPIPPTPNVNIMGKVAVVNASSESDNDVAKWVNAVKKQCDTDVSRYWAYSLDVEFIPKGSTIPKADIYMGVVNNSTESGVLGWHDYQNGKPSIQIFTQESRKYGLNPSTTISHEFAELIGDVDCSTTVQGYDESGKACLYFRENCDPVEDERFGYQVDNVLVSDFITPTWFVKAGVAPYDFRGKCTKPYQILAGGYMEVSYDGGRNWTQIDKFNEIPNKDLAEFKRQQHQRSHSRWDIYKKIRAGEPLQECEFTPGKDIAGGILYTSGKL